MTETTTIGFAVIETVVVTDDQGNVTSESANYRVAAADEVKAILSAAQGGQSSISA